MTKRQKKINPEWDAPLQAMIDHPTPPVCAEGLYVIAEKFLASDAQHDCVYWVALAPNMTLGSVHIVDYGRSEDSLEEAVHKLQGQVWRGPDYEGLAKLTLVDSGDGLMVPRVYKLARSYRHKRVAAIHGVAAAQALGQFYRLAAGKERLAEHGGRLVLAYADRMKSFYASLLGPVVI